MASKAFFDPMVLFRVAPLVSSTFALRFSVDQYSFLNVLLAQEHREDAKHIIPSYFRIFFRNGIWHIGVLYGVSFGSGIANFFSKPNAAWRWYAAGTALTLAHMAFAPKIMWSIKDLYDDEPKGQGDKHLKKWLDIHVIRSVLADFPAWVCFGIACLKSFQPL
ncbi:hypothetical protein JX265_001362 [Neoarthrinium moseri]|uniref:Uncharacterized protein n=1 Tax=Neoarthrinium moseri TaxID=1658444 RepID=A0A9Q0ART8_9PEZI|nr:hypothetical protein JX265_001362 [Neoarthrinium moseri]